MSNQRYILTACLLLFALTTGCDQTSAEPKGGGPTPTIEQTIKPNPGIRDSDTLIFYLSKSDLVVTGQIVTRDMPALILAKGESHYIATFRIEEVLYGEPPPEAQFTVDIIRPEINPGDAGEYLKPGFQCILFLKRQSHGNTPAWATADNWFGMQFYDSMMIHGLKVLLSP